MQQIIVYRNPLEAALWNSLTFESIVSAIVFGVVIMSMIMLIDRVFHLNHKSAFVNNLSLVVSFVTAGYCAFFHVFPHGVLTDV